MSCLEQLVFKGRLTNRFFHAKRPLDAVSWLPHPSPPFSKASIHQNRFFKKKLNEILGLSIFRLLMQILGVSSSWIWFYLFIGHLGFYQLRKTAKFQKFVLSKIENFLKEPKISIKLKLDCQKLVSNRQAHVVNRQVSFSLTELDRSKRTGCWIPTINIYSNCQYTILPVTSSY